MRNRFSLVTLALASLILGTAAQAKPTQYLLTDLINDTPLPNTPYFMSGAGIKPQAKPLLTDEHGRTHPVASKPQIFVQAEGTGPEIFINNLNDLKGSNSGKIGKGTPYTIFNYGRNQALCGVTNEQGFTYAYFIDNVQSWADNSFIFQRTSPNPINLSCSNSRDVANNLLGKDSDAFLKAYDNAGKTFVLDDLQKKLFLYRHIDLIIQDKSVNLKKGAAAKVIQRGEDLAIAQKDVKQLNSIGYALGFERQEYKRGIEILDEALLLVPKDCYISNSKGYLLMRTGDNAQAQKYFYDADESCRAAAAAHQGKSDENDYNYPLAVNDAHLAENYGQLGDAFLANDFFGRALKVGSARAKDEIAEVAKHLREKQLLNDENQRLYALYVQFVQQAAQEPVAKPKADVSNAKPRKKGR